MSCEADSAVRRVVARPLALALGLLALLAVAGPAGAQERDPSDPDEVARFVDGVIAEQMEEHGIPGAVFVMVKDGEVFVSKGYGHTDLERRATVDPERTRFDVGSVTKLFTATAVMQQVEQGRIELDADVNRYLDDVEVPETFPQAVTMEDLLTHTAGFADRHFVGMVVGSPAEAEPLAEVLAATLPPRIRPPGQVHQYSNHGMALAGHAVEAVSGQAFEDYLAAEVLRPLRMTRTTFGETPDAPSDDAVGHESLAGPTAAVEPWYLNVRPAGGLWSTGADMARFMLAHLQGGEHDGARILEASTVATMQRTQFTPHPELSAIGYGFFERRAEGRRVVQHGGGWIGFGSMLFLLPDEGVGVFVSYNHGQGVPSGVALGDALFERYFPVRDVESRPPAGARERNEALAGDFRWNRHDRDTFMRLVSALQTQYLRVQAAGDGTLTTTMSPFALLPETRWVESEPGVFRSRAGDNTLVFEADGEGGADRLHVAGAQFFTMERIAWHETRAFTFASLLFFAGALLLGALAWPGGRVYRRLRRRRDGVPGSVRLARLAGGLAALLGLLFLVGFALFFAADAVAVLQVSTGFKALLWLPLLGAAATSALLVAVVLLWTRRDGSTVTRLYHSALLLVLLAFLPFLYHWRLLGFHY